MFRPALLAFLALLILAGAASAHAGARSAEADFSDGAGVVRIALDSPVEQRGLRAEIDLNGIVADADVRRDPQDPAAILVDLSELRPATQTVSWSALSVDGHLSRGSVTVAAPTGLGRVGEIRQLDGGDDPDGLVLALGRGLAIAGLLAALGLVIFDGLVLAPAWRSGGVLPPLSALRPDAVRRAAAGPLRSAHRPWWRIWWASLAIAALGSLTWIVATIGAAAESPGDVGGLLGDTRPGSAWLMIAAGLGLAAIVAAIAARREPPAGPVLRPAVGVILGAFLAVAVVGVSVGGHAATGSEPVLNVAADALHSGATAAWLGGLVGLWILLRRPLTDIAGRAQTALSAGVVVRFSALAITAVGVLTLTGVYRALVELSRTADLWETGYGRWLAIKIGLFVVMLGIAAANRFVLHVRLERAALGLVTDDRGAVGALRTSVRAEMAFAGAVLIAVAALVAAAPPA